MICRLCGGLVRCRLCRHMWGIYDVGFAGISGGLMRRRLCRVMWGIKEVYAM